MYIYIDTLSKVLRHIVCRRSERVHRMWVRVIPAGLPRVLTDWPFPPAALALPGRVQPFPVSAFLGVLSRTRQTLVTRKRNPCPSWQRKVWLARPTAAVQMVWAQPCPPPPQYGHCPWPVARCSGWGGNASAEGRTAPVPQCTCSEGPGLCHSTVKDFKYHPSLCQVQLI